MSLLLEFFLGLGLPFLWIWKLEGREKRQPTKDKGRETRNDCSRSGTEELSILCPYLLMYRPLAWCLIAEQGTARNPWLKKEDAASSGCPL